MKNERTNGSLTNKKMWIILSVFFSLILLIVLSSFIFSLKEVSVNFLDDYKHRLVDVTNEEIIQAGNFDFGSSVFLVNENKYIRNIEKKFPYLDVVNIEMKFPNKAVVHCYERIQQYIIKCEDGYVVTDKNLFVLSRKEGEPQLANENGVYLPDVKGVKTESVYKISEGETLKNVSYDDFKFYEALSICFEEYIISGVDEYTYLYVEEQFSKNFRSAIRKGNDLLIEHFDGIKLKIKDVNYAFVDKFRLALSTYQEVKSKGNNMSKGYVEVRYSENKGILAFYSPND